MHECYITGCIGVIKGLLASRSDLLGSDFLNSKNKNPKAEPCLPCASVSIETLSPVASMPVICAGALPPRGLSANAPPVAARTRILAWPVPVVYAERALVLN